MKMLPITVVIMLCAHDIQFKCFDTIVMQRKSVLAVLQDSIFFIDMGTTSRYVMGAAKRLDYLYIGIGLLDRLHVNIKSANIYCFGLYKLELTLPVCRVCIIKNELQANNISK